MNFNFDHKNAKPTKPTPPVKPKEKEVRMEKNHWFVDEFSKRFENYSPDNRQQTDIPSNYLRVSELTGGCLRKAFYRLTGETGVEAYSKQNKLRMDVGTKLHEVVQDAMGDYLSEVETRYYDHDLKITGQIDGFVPSENVLMDIKTAGLATFVIFQLRRKAKIAHIHQLHWYIKLYNKKHNTNCDKGIIFYLNRNVDIYFNDYVDFSYTKPHEVKELWLDDGHKEDCYVSEVAFDQDIMDKQIEKINDFWNRVDNTKKAPAKTTAKYMCDGCPYKEMCYAKKVKK